MKYTFTYGRNSQLIWALILPAFIGLIPLMLVLELSKKYNYDGDWIVILATFLYLAIVITATLLWVNSIRSDVEITFDKDELHFNFVKNNIFHKRDFILHLSNLKNTSEDNDKGFDFLYIETHNTSSPSFHLMAKEGDENFANFKQTLYQTIEIYNTIIQEENLIKNDSIYQKWPMKLLAILLLACWFIFPLLMYFRETDWFFSIKYWLFVLVSSPLILKVYFKNFRR